MQKVYAIIEIDGEEYELVNWDDSLTTKRGDYVGMHQIMARVQDKYYPIKLIIK